VAKRLFVTGLRGFVGRHLARRIAGEPQTMEIAHTPEFDLRDRTALERILGEVQPELVIHLAAQSAVPQSFADPRTTYDVNFFGTLNLLEALAATRFRGRLLYIGSGDAYGRVSDASLPINETQPLRPRSPYAVSKAAAEALCFQWSQTGPFEIVLARPFNSIGPEQSTRFAIPDFAQRIVEISVGRGTPRLETGDVDVTRDFTDVRDVVAAYSALLVKGVNGEVYNVCSGRERVLRDLINQMAAIAGITVELVADPARHRHGEQRRMAGNPAKLIDATGWSASIPIDTTLRDIIDDWRGRLQP